LVREEVRDLDHDFRTRYATTGRPSLPPEPLLSALLWHVFYGVRSDRHLMEQLDYNLLYRWCVGLSPDDAVWDATTCTKNRERLQAGDRFNRFMETLLNHSDVRPVLSDEQFSVDGTLIEAWASHNSFKPKDDQDGDGTNFHGTTRQNDTHASTTDPDRRLYRKSEGTESTLCDRGHATMENKNGLAVTGIVTPATGTAAREASEDMLAEHASVTHRITAGMDKAYDVKEHLERLRAKHITPHVAQNNTKEKCHRRENHATHRLRQVANLSQDDWMHFWLGEAARHHAQDQAAGHGQGCTLHAESHRLPPHSHPEIAAENRIVGPALPTMRRYTGGTPPPGHVPLP
jgi:transposase